MFKSAMLIAPILKHMTIAMGHETWSSTKGMRTLLMAIALDLLLAEIPGEMKTEDVAHLKLFVSMSELSSCKKAIVKLDLNAKLSMNLVLSMLAIPEIFQLKMELLSMQLKNDLASVTPTLL